MKKLFFIMAVISITATSCAQDNVAPACTTCPTNPNTGTTMMFAVPGEPFPSYYTYDQAFPIYTGFAGVDPTNGFVKCDLFNGVPTGSRMYWFGMFKIASVGLNTYGQYVVTGYTGQTIYAIVDRGFYQQLTAGSVFQLTQQSNMIASSNKVAQNDPVSGTTKYYLDPSAAKKTFFIATPLR